MARRGGDGQRKAYLPRRPRPRQRPRRPHAVPADAAGGARRGRGGRRVASAAITWRFPTPSARRAARAAAPVTRSRRFRVGRAVGCALRRAPFSREGHASRIGDPDRRGAARNSPAAAAQGARAEARARAGARAARLATGTRGAGGACGRQGVRCGAARAVGGVGRGVPSRSGGAAPRGAERRCADRASAPRDRGAFLKAHGVFESDRPALAAGCRCRRRCAAGVRHMALADRARDLLDATSAGTARRRQSRHVRWRCRPGAAAHRSSRAAAVSCRRATATHRARASARAPDADSRDRKDAQRRIQAGGDDLVIGGAQVTNISVNGKVLSAEAKQSAVEYVLDDGTGKIPVKHWNSEDAGDVMMPVGTYATAYGKWNNEMTVLDEVRHRSTRSRTTP